MKKNYGIGSYGNAVLSVLTFLIWWTVGFSYLGSRGVASPVSLYWYVYAIPFGEFAFQLIFYVNIVIRYWAIQAGVKNIVKGRYARIVGSQYAYEMIWAFANALSKIYLILCLICIVFTPI